MTEKSPKLLMAEAYYAVAADLQRNAQDQIDIASRLSRYADQLCEQNMRETPAPECSKCGGIFHGDAECKADTSEVQRD